MVGVSGRRDEVEGRVGSEGGGEEIGDVKGVGGVSWI